MGRCESGPTYVYRLADDDGTLLYVGIAADPGRRFTQHAKVKRWWCDVAHIDLELCDTRESALSLERRAILNEQPLYNIVYNADNAGRIGEVRWFCDECKQQTHDGVLVIEVGRGRDHIRDALAGIPFPHRVEPGLCRPLHRGCVTEDLAVRHDDGGKAFIVYDLYDYTTTRDVYGLAVCLMDIEEIGGTYAQYLFHNALSWEMSDV